MEQSSAGVSVWARAVGDPAFRDALIDDPLRAIAAAPGVTASPEQVRQLEEMDHRQRTDYVMGVVREIHTIGSRSRFGPLGPDGRLGGVPDPPPSES